MERTKRRKPESKLEKQQGAGSRRGIGGKDFGAEHCRGLDGEDYTSQGTQVLSAWRGEQWGPPKFRYRWVKDAWADLQAEEG
ncbi:hypothetical protein VTH82DRAFT_4197 [Thermothelomyces myriococcoides]